MSEFTSRSIGKQFATALPLETSPEIHCSVELLVAEEKTASITTENVNNLLQALNCQRSAIPQNIFSPEIIIIDLKRMMSLTGMSRTTIYRWCLNGRLPKPHRLGSGQNRWLLSDVIPYLEAMVGKAGVAV